MVLSGTLREYILADVFQLLMQQKITGKLILNSGKNDGFVIFKNGQVIYAEKNNEKYLDKILIYINSFSDKSSSNINDLFSSFENNIHRLSLELIKEAILSKEELLSLFETIIEDICCSLFLWKNGTYRFTSLRSVEDFSPSNQVFPVENIVMEAMRRSDEWCRMQEFVNEDTVFVRTNKESFADKSYVNPIKQPQEFILSCIDGTSPVSELVKDCCLSEYKIYEILYNLYTHKTIIPLSEQYTRSVQAALQQKKREQSTSPFSSLISVTCAVCIFAILIFTASMVVKSVFLSQSTNRYRAFKTQNQRSVSEQKLTSASLYYRTFNGRKYEKLKQLSSLKLINNHDIFILNLDTIFKEEIKKRNKS